METIQAKDLRVGNIIHNMLVNEIQTIEEIYRESFNASGCFTTIGYCKPIELTEEWLIKFGFKEYIRSNGKTYDLKDFWEIDYENGKYFISEIEVMDIKYVHQLQNLYFALTGKELEIR